MSMGDMSPEALERIVRIETKLDMLVEMIPKMQELQLAHERAAQSAKSAHHRIDNIYKSGGAYIGHRICCHCINRKGAVICLEKYGTPQYNICQR